MKLRLTPEGVVKLARVAANEDSRPLRRAGDGNGTAGVPTRDTYAIAQVVHDWAAWQGTTHDYALRSLAPHVAGHRAPKRARHAVYSELPATGLLAPLHWERERDGDWRVHGPLWARFRDAVRALVRDGFPAPCASPVIAWGNEGDDHIALSRGLARVQCGDGAVNRYWGKPPSVVDAAVARGGRR